MINSRLKMSGMRIIMHILCGFVLIVAVFGQSCSPRYPAAMPSQPGHDPSQSAGLWYAYRQTGPQRLVVGNKRTTIKNYAQIIHPLTNNLATRQYLQATWAVNGTCNYGFWTGTYLVNGQQDGKDLVSADNYSVIRDRAYAVLYHDYQKLMIVYGCIKPKLDGSCGAPFIWGQTRTRPDLLSTADMESFDGIINAALKNYCITIENLPRQMYDDKQPACPFLDPPTCIASIIKGMQEGMPTNDSNPAPATSTTGHSAPSTGVPMRKNF